MVNIDELMRLSKAAQSRPWKARPEYHSYDGGQEYTLYCIENANNTITEVNDEEADAEYICAACNAAPELVARISELEYQRDWLASKAAEMMKEIDKYTRSPFKPPRYHSMAQWRYFAEEAEKNKDELTPKKFIMKRFTEVE